MLYVAVVPVQTVPLPMMDPGAGGAESTDTAIVEAEDVPQPFDAVTVTTPPDEPAAAMMESAVEAPVHPAGSVQA
jgi:hypothetical protein